MKTKYLYLIMCLAILTASCKKAPEIPVAAVQLSNEIITPYTRTVTVTTDYSYPTELKDVTFLISKNSDMSEPLSSKATIVSSKISAEATGLEGNTAYYCCFEFKSGKTVSKSEVKSFTTLDYSKPTVTTNAVSNVTATSAKCGGYVVDDGDQTVNARGICWSTEQNPVIENNPNITANGTGIGSFTSSISGLSLSTKYYVRAYATNDKGTSYGAEKSFTTKDGMSELTTSSVTNVMATSVTSGGNVTSDGGFPVKARGVCWSTAQNPVIENNPNITTNGTGTGTFTSSLTDLSLSTKYYVRAYARNDNGISYGEEKSFTTKDGKPELTTNPATNVARTSATLNGNIVSAGLSEIKVCGFEYGTDNTLSSNTPVSVSVVQSGAIQTSLTGLAEGTTYYYRAYATNDFDTSYGEILSFKTLDPPVFSVSSSKRVKFSQGNLQYQASTDTWRFAENQYDCIGANNGHISPTYSGWIDLFGWGTSGYNNKYPYMTSTNYSDYGNGNNNISGTNYDWGVYNAISNGGNQSGMWRTLTKDEWVYLFNTRTGASSKYSQATVNNVRGLIILPDSWTLPSGVTFTAQANNWTSNNYSVSQWNLMESNGAVFLPAAGYRDGASVLYVGACGHYWSSSYNNEYNACYVSFYSDNVSPSGYGDRYDGHSVRLVADY